MKKIMMIVAMMMSASSYAADLGGPVQVVDDAPVLSIAHASLRGNRLQIVVTVDGTNEFDLYGVPGGDNGPLVNGDAVTNLPSEMGWYAFTGQGALLIEVRDKITHHGSFMTILELTKDRSGLQSADEPYYATRGFLLSDYADDIRACDLSLDELAIRWERSGSAKRFMSSLAHRLGAGTVTPRGGGDVIVESTNSNPTYNGESDFSGGRAGRVTPPMGWQIAQQCGVNDSRGWPIYALRTPNGAVHPYAMSTIQSGVAVPVPPAVYGSCR